MDWWGHWMYKLLKDTHTETMTLVFPNSAYADPAAAFTAPVLKTVDYQQTWVSLCA